MAISLFDENDSPLSSTTKKPEEVPVQGSSPGGVSLIEVGGPMFPSRTHKAFNEAEKAYEKKQWEWTHPGESFAIGSGFSAAGQGLKAGGRALAKRGMLGKVGQKLLSTPVPGLPGMVSKAVGAGLTAIPLFTAADVPRNLIKQTEFAEEHPIASEVASIGTDIATGVGAQKAMKTIPKVVKAIDVVSNSPIVKFGQKVTEGLWDNAVMGPVNYLTNPDKALLENVKDGTIKKVLQGSMTPVQRTGRFFREKIQPAIERLDKETAEVFTHRKVQENLLAQEGEKLGQEMAKLPLPDRLDVMKGIRGEEMHLLSDKAKDVLSDSRIRILQSDIDPRMVKKHDEVLGKLYTHVLKAPEDVLTSRKMRDLLEGIEKDVGEGKWFRNFRVRMKISDAISDPAVSDAEATLLKELFQLPATTPEMVLQASRAASQDFIKRSLLKAPGGRALVSPTEIPGFVKSNAKRFKGLWVDRDTNLELEALENIEKYSHGVFNKYFTTPWKTAKIILSPASQIRNTFTNFMLNDIGGLPVYRLDIYNKAFGEMKKDSKLWKEFARTTGGGGTFGRNELSQLETTWKFSENWYDVPNKLLGTTTKYPKALYNANEQVFKFAKYLHNIEKGMGKVEAARDAIIPTFDYSSITPAVAAARSHFMPFATWTSKVIPYTIEQTVKHPLRVGKWFAMYEVLQNLALQNANMSEEEFANFKSRMPDYIQKGAYLLMPWRDSQDRLNMLDLTYIVPGLGDIREMAGKGIWETTFQHPAITLPADLLRNKSFTGAPIVYDWQDGKTQAAKYFSHIWQSTMPSWTPGGTDWKRYFRSMSETPGAQTVSQAIAQQFGVKIQPLDKKQISRIHESMIKKGEAEITTEMNKELRMTKDPQERREILSRYIEIKKRFLREKLGRKPGRDLE